MMEATAGYTGRKLYKESPLSQDSNLFNSATIVELDIWKEIKKESSKKSAHSSNDTIDEIINRKKNGYQTNIKANINSSTNNSFSRKVGATMFTLPLILTESAALAKEQIKNDMIADTKKISMFSIISTAFAGAFGLPFWVILIFIFGVAILETLLSSMKRFRLPGVDYAPIAKLQVFGGAIIVFVAFSLVQIFGEFAIWKVQGATLQEILAVPLTSLGLEKASHILNFQLVGAFFIIWFYLNSMKKMFSQGAGVQINPQTQLKDTQV